MLQIHMLNQKCMFSILNCGFEDLRTVLEHQAKENDELFSPFRSPIMSICSEQTITESKHKAIWRANESRLIVLSEGLAERLISNP